MEETESWVVEVDDDWGASLERAADAKNGRERLPTFQSRAAALESHLRYLRRTYATVQAAQDVTSSLIDRPMSVYHRTTAGIWTLDITDVWLPRSNLIEGADDSVVDGLLLFSSRNEALTAHFWNLRREEMALWLAINRTTRELVQECGGVTDDPRGFASHWRIMKDTDPDE